jgi:putative SOS response-associated peptidase YedK
MRTFATSTTDACELVADIHDRPSFLSQATTRFWLGEEADRAT